MSGAGVPPGWPAGVRPPLSEGWERSATAWLLDLCPPEYRAYEVLRRYPVILARFATHCVAAGLEGSRRGFATTRAELRDLVPQEAVDATLQAYEREGARLVRLAREVDVVSFALQGGTFRARL